MFNFNFFKKKKPIDEICKEEIEKPIKMSLEEQFLWIKNQGWLLNENFNINNENILIMDDRNEIISSIMDDLYSLDEQTSFNINNYNILSTTTKMAGFYVLDILEKAPDIVINYALLDIILGGKKITDEKRIMVDGVDIAIQIWERFPQSNILFVTGCIIENSPDKSNFKYKFDKYTNDDLNNYLLSKVVEFDTILEKLSNFFNVY